MVRRLLAVLAASTVAAGAAEAAASTIYFNCGDDLCRVRPDGEGRKRLTRDGRPDLYGSVSAAKSVARIAFSRGNRILVADRRARARRAVRLPRKGRGGAPMMLPSGRSLLWFQRVTLTHSSICHGGPGRRPRCGDATVGGGYIGLGPGLSLLFAPSGDERNSLCITNLAFRCRRRLVEDDPRYSFYFDPVASPDGRLVAVPTYRDDGYELVLLDARTGRQIRRLTRGHDDTDPAFSPDGRHVVFRRDVETKPGEAETNATIAYVPVRGGRARTVLRAPGVHSPDWGP